MASAIKLQLRVLLDEEYELSSFNNVCAAKEYLAENQCELIISDLNLPDSKGSETMNVLNKYSHKAQVVFMSGTADEIEHIDQSHYPNTCFIMKDMNFNQSMLNVLSKKLNLKTV
jgi:DNA-binding NtrC family response regulator